jgi:hypothetical protein
MEETPRQSSNRADIECSSRTRRNRGARLLAASRLRKTCWWASPSLLRCAKGTSPERSLRRPPDNARFQGDEKLVQLLELLA